MNMIPFIRNNHFMLLAGHKRTYNKWTYFEIFSLLCTHDTMNRTIIYDIKLLFITNLQTFHSLHISFTIFHKISYDVNLILS